MMAKPIKIDQLSPAQSEIMEIVFKNGAVSVRDVAQIISRRRTVARRLPYKRC